MYKSKYINNIKKNNTPMIIILFEISFILMLFQNNVFPNVFTSEFYMLFISTGALMYLLVKRKYYHKYFTFYLAFILYYFVLSKLIYNRDSKFSNNRILMMSIIWIMLVLIYNYIVIIKDTKRFMKIYILVSLVSLISIVILVGDNLFESRLGHNGIGTTVSYYLFNKPIFKSSNSTARFCSIAAFFCAYFAMYEKKKIYYILMSFFSYGVILTGSRKGILILAIFLIYSLFKFMKVRIDIKIIRISIIAILVGILIFKVPFFYQQIGKRMWVLISNIFELGNAIGDGNSYVMRQNLANLAISYIIKSPFIGVGLGVFGAENSYNGFLVGTENNYLDILVSGGIFAFGLYYSYIIFLINEIKTIYFSKSLTIKIMFVIVLTILINDIGSMTYFLINSLMWISILFAVIKNEKNSKRYINRIEGYNEQYKS